MKVTPIKNINNVEVIKMAPLNDDKNSFLRLNKVSIRKIIRGIEYKNTCNVSFDILECDSLFSEVFFVIILLYMRRKLRIIISLIIPLENRFFLNGSHY